MSCVDMINKYIAAFDDADITNTATKTQNIIHFIFETSYFS